MYNIAGVDVDDAAETLIDDCLNRSWWEIMNKFKFREKDIAASFTLVASQAIYDCPDPFEAMRSIAIVDDDNKHHYIERVTSKWYEEHLDTDTDSDGFPTNYFREGSTITLWPTPDAAYNAVLRYTTTLADLSTSNSLPEIPQEWHEIILYGGVWRLLLELGDFNRTNEIKKHQVSLIETCIPVEAKEASDARYANLEFVGSRYEL